jgi:hypothetical protein
MSVGAAQSRAARSARRSRHQIEQVESKESAMNAPAGLSETVPAKTSDRLHPVVHKAAAALLIWFVIAAWLLFGGAGYIELALAMVSVLVFMALAIPTALLRTSIRAQRSGIAAHETMNADAAERDEPSERLGHWLRGRFATWTDQEKSSTATIEILLPLAAVAFGITALGIVFNVARAAAG